MTKKHESSWKVNVGTVKKSQATIASRWVQSRQFTRRLDQTPGLVATGTHSDASFRKTRPPIQPLWRRSSQHPPATRELALALLALFLWASRGLAVTSQS